MNMTNREYAEYLQSDKWKAIAQKRLEIDGGKCVCCGCTGTAKNPIEIHHLSYRYLGEEEGRIYQDLCSLCHVCHKMIHKIMERVTSEDGRRGWLDNPRIPTVHVYNIGGLLEYTEGKNE